MRPEQLLLTESFALPPVKCFALGSPGSSAPCGPLPRAQARGCHGRVFGCGARGPGRGPAAGRARGADRRAGGSSSASPGPQAPCPLPGERLCALLRESATAAARPGPLFRFSGSSGQVSAAARGARTCLATAGTLKPAGAGGASPGSAGHEVPEAVVVGRRRPPALHYPIELGGAPPGPGPLPTAPAAHPASG